MENNEIMNEVIEVVDDVQETATKFIDGRSAAIGGGAVVGAIVAYKYGVKPAVKWVRKKIDDRKAKKNAGKDENAYKKEMENLDESDVK